MKDTILVLFVVLMLVSCIQKEEKLVVESNIKNEISLSEDIKKISLEIGGMTCEIGCAKLIESRLSKTKGVKTASVIFNDSLGNVSFDANQVSLEEIVKSIEKIADGELYTVKKVTETEQIKP